MMRHIMIMLSLSMMAGCASPRSLTLTGAVASHDMGKVREHLEEGKDINKKDNKGRTPLILAAYYRNPAILEYLLARGAELDHQDVHGYTALMYAAYYDDLENVKTLARHGAHLGLTNKKGWSALDLARYYHHHEVARFLQDAVKVSQK